MLAITVALAASCSSAPKRVAIGYGTLWDYIDQICAARGFPDGASYYEGDPSKISCSVAWPLAKPEPTGDFPVPTPMPLPRVCISSPGLKDCMTRIVRSGGMTACRVPENSNLSDGLTCVGRDIRLTPDQRRRLRVLEVTPPPSLSPSPIPVGTPSMARPCGGFPNSADSLVQVAYVAGYARALADARDPRFAHYRAKAHAMILAAQRCGQTWFR